jgi:ubiquinone/menaquinone biosynthesis C-methylase UbiE
MSVELDGSRPKGYKGLPMEGFVARRYARLRRTDSQLEQWRRQAAELTEGLPDGSEVLEVAPGPGYLAIELARSGRFRVTGLDISRTFVELATENARAAGVHVTFQLGDASRMPFLDESFDLIVCQAAFKNFSRPNEAIGEMHRVLREGGTAVIQDMKKDATDGAIRQEVNTMGLGRLSAWTTRRILGGLRGRSYTEQQFAALAAASRFGGAEISTEGIGVEVRLKKARSTAGPDRLALA